MVIPSSLITAVADSARFVGAATDVNVGSVELLLTMSASSAFQSNADCDVSLSVRFTRKSPAS